MKLILQKDVKNLGKTGEQVSVKKGFARNYLIPKGFAIVMNKSSEKAWEHQKTIIEAKKRKVVSERKTLIEKLSHIKLKFEKEAQKDNRLFGSVTAHEISQALETLHKLSIDKRDIHFSELKTVGDHKVTIKLDNENQTEIKLAIKGKIRKADYEIEEAKKAQETSDDDSQVEEAKQLADDNPQAEETKQLADESNSEDTQTNETKQLADESNSEDTQTNETKQLANESNSEDTQTNETKQLANESNSEDTQTNETKQLANESNSEDTQAK